MKLNLKKVNPLIKMALKEDIGKGDITTSYTVPEDSQGLALILNKQEGVLAGIDVCKQVFLTVDKELQIEATMVPTDVIHVAPAQGWLLILE